MRVTCLVVILVLSAGLLVAAETDEQPITLKSVSPTFGIALLQLDTWGDVDGYVGRQWLLGTDFRLSWKNVPSRSGFYHGVEVGAIFFLPHNPPPGMLAGFTDSYVGAVTTTYTITMRYYLGMAFALAKYGYRLDFGSAATGFSLAGELGIGARLVDGHFDLEVGGISGYPDSADMTYWDPGIGALGFLLGAAVELHLRIGNRFRFFITPEILLNDPFLRSQEEHAAWDDRNDLPPDGISDGIDSLDEARALTSRYTLTTQPQFFSVGLGFSVSY